MRTRSLTSAALSQAGNCLRCKCTMHGMHVLFQSTSFNLQQRNVISCSLSNYPIQLRPATTFFNFTFRLLRSLEHTVDAADQSTAENQYRTSGIPRLIVDLACLLFKALRAPGRNRKLDCKKAFCQLNLSDAPLSLSLPRHGEKMETDLNKSNLVFKSLSHSSFAKLW